VNGEVETVWEEDDTA